MIRSLIISTLITWALNLMPKGMKWRADLAAASIVFHSPCFRCGLTGGIHTECCPMKSK